MRFELPKRDKVFGRDTNKVSKENGDNISEKFINRFWDYSSSGINTL